MKTVQLTQKQLEQVLRDAAVCASYAALHVPATERKTPVKIAVVGSREYPDLAAVRQFVWEQERTTVIVSGGARGVDETAVNEARRLGMPYEVHTPDWMRYGRRAGAVRNQQIVDAAHEVVAFWDGTSRGTKITIDMANAVGKPVRIVLPRAQEGR